LHDIAGFESVSNARVSRLRSAGNRIAVESHLWSPAPGGDPQCKLLSRRVAALEHFDSDGFAKRVLCRHLEAEALGGRVEGGRDVEIHDQLGTGAPVDRVAVLGMTLHTGAHAAPEIIER